MKKDIFLLDMDDTLFDFHRTEQINLIDTLGEFGISADMRVWQRFHDINKSLWEQYERGEIEREQIKISRFERLFAEYGYYASDIAAVANKYFENFKEICIPFDGATEFLKKLADVGRIYIVTNGNSACQHRHLTDAGFLPFIEYSFISDEIGFAKPSIQFAEHVMSHIEGFDRERAVWIGDSLTSDMECAKRAGIDFILFAHGETPAEYGGVSAENFGEALKILHIN